MELNTLKNMPLGQRIAISEKSDGHYSASGLYGGIVELGHNGDSTPFIRYFPRSTKNLEEFLKAKEQNPNTAEKILRESSYRLLKVSDIQVKAI